MKGVITYGGYYRSEHPPEDLLPPVLRRSEGGVRRVRSAGHTAWLPQCALLRTRDGSTVMRGRAMARRGSTFGAEHGLLLLLRHRSTHHLRSGG
jgi:hypothetical protein